MNKEDLILQAISRLDDKINRLEDSRIQDRQDMLGQFGDIKTEMRYERQRLDEVYDARKTLEIKFSSLFTGINLLFAGIVAYFVAMFR